MIETIAKERFFQIHPQSWAQIVLLSGFCIVLFFLNLGQWDLWNPDEPRYAQVAREMVQGGDWVLMHFNGNVYADKPPLFFWLIGLSSYLWQGFTSFSVRFPSALFGTLAVVITYFLGKSLYSSRTGFLSGLILATSLDFAYLSTRANIDTTLTFYTTGALFCFFQWYRHHSLHPFPLLEGEKARVTRNLNGPGSLPSQSIYGFYIAMALAILTKGPVGFILPLLIGLVFLVIQKDWIKLREMRLLSGLLLMTAIVLCWYLPAVFKGGEVYLNETLFRQTLDRYAKGWSHVRPIYYYFYSFPLDFLPWSFFLPAAVAYGLSKEGMKKINEFFFLLVWGMVIFIFFSLSKGKRDLYLLPLFPAVSLLIGKLWDDLISSSMERFPVKWITFSLYIWMGLTFVAGAAIPWVVWTRFPSYLPYGLPVAFLFVGGSLAAFVLLRFKNYCAIFFLLIGTMAGGFFYTLRVVFPLINPYKSARFISQEVTSRVQPGEKLGLYGGVGSGPYNFYTGIVPILELKRPEDLINFLRSSERVFCLLRYSDFSQIQSAKENPECQLIVRRPVGNNDMVLISNW